LEQVIDFRSTNIASIAWQGEPIATKFAMEIRVYSVTRLLPNKFGNFPGSSYCNECMTKIKMVSPNIVIETIDRYR